MAKLSAREIKNRIRSMEATAQITKAMELVAASKLRKAQSQLASSRPYFEALCTAVQEILANDRSAASPYLLPPSGGKLLYIVIAGDRGLAGGYNSNAFKLLSAQPNSQEFTVLPIGKCAVDFCRSHRLPMWTVSAPEAAEVSVGDCFSISDRLAAAFREREFDEIRIVYTAFASALSQIPESRRLLPLIREECAPRRKPSSLTVYEPDPETAWEAIVPAYLGGVLYGALCESRTSELAARRTAMDSATSNAEEMISDLKLKFNRVRQSAITQEISEIVAGS